MLAILAVFVFAPALGQAAPLLSGYGGPGSGSQAILGSTLIGGGGGSTSGGGGAATPAGSAEAGGEPSRSSSGSSSGPRHAQTHSGAHSSPQRAGSSRSAAPATQETVATQTARVATDASAGGWQVGGLSGLDLFYVLMIAAFLVLAAVLTGRLARRPE
ncbi:MAG TPA: hypothetical protein VK774_01650 [Solirubrobacteraceae bacterium]|nr:hypothetical protein [Solirubrobacteraceae bacterium]